AASSSRPLPLEPRKENTAFSFYPSLSVQFSAVVDSQEDATEQTTAPPETPEPTQTVPDVSPEEESFEPPVDETEG
ncbi:hypothetical protein, partial [Nesterenkonia lutea]|uniref:hypothetical protein n=1 Tax=Nesterenkonia lutea TaxID=272919 RepID=UPI0031CE10E4